MQNSFQSGDIDPSGRPRTPPADYEPNRDSYPFLQQISSLVRNRKPIFAAKMGNISDRTYSTWSFVDQK